MKEIDKPVHCSGCLRVAAAQDIGLRALGPLPNETSPIGMMFCFAQVGTKSLDLGHFDFRGSASPYFGTRHQRVGWLRPQGLGHILGSPNHQEEFPKTHKQNFCTKEPPGLGGSHDQTILLDFLDPFGVCWDSLVVQTLKHASATDEIVRSCCTAGIGWFSKSLAWISRVQMSIILGSGDLPHRDFGRIDEHFCEAFREGL